MVVGRCNILIIGSGAREHAIGWKLSMSRPVKTYYANGNGGTWENINISPDDFESLLAFAKENQCITVVGPEDPLSKGIVNYFSENGLKIFGPSKEAAMLETSKYYAKQFMERYNIATPKSAAFTDPREAKDYVLEQDSRLVVKADGLAAGKGVMVCNNKEEALAAVETIMVNRAFGNAGSRIIIEERLYGQEVSFIGICDGKTIIPLASSQDHKRVFDGDNGPNTGGMGSYSPASIIDPTLHEKIMKDIMQRTVNGMKAEGTPYKGFLYAGIMLEEDTGKPYVLEFNARMGDPECQPLMMRMKSDLFDYIEGSIEERLDTLPPIEWSENFAVCVVMASKGYPGNYSKGKVIHGLDTDFNSAMIFHAGTTRDKENRVVTNGGRVLSVTALGTNARTAIDNAYLAVNKISWGQNDYHYRSDIGRRALLSSKVK